MEILIVMAVVAILVGMIIPSYRSIQNDAWVGKAKIETRTLRDAIERFSWRHNRYPTDFLELVPDLLDKIPDDPWRTNTLTDKFGTIYNTYGYLSGYVTGSGYYYIVYSRGIDGRDDVRGSEPVNGRLVLPAGSDDIVESTLIVVKQ